MEKGKHRMREEEADDRKAKKLKRETILINFENLQGDDEEDIFYGEDSYSYGGDEDEDIKDCGSSFLECCTCERGDPIIPLGPQIDWCASEKVCHWADWEGLNTPVLIIEVKGVGNFYFPIDEDDPLPQELYDARQRHRVLPDLSKEAYDERIRSLARGDVDEAYRELPQAVQAEIARIALAFFRDSQDVDYKYVRCVKSYASFKPLFGIHMIFIAHRGDDISTGSLFSVHLVTTDPPRVLDCRILCDIDAEYIFKGKPRLNNVKVPLKRKNIACRFCALNFNKMKKSGATI